MKLPKLKRIGLYLLVFGLSAMVMPFSYADLTAATQSDDVITLSTDRFNNLGVILGELEPVAQIPMLTAPAKVVVPPTNDYLVSASQSGLITQLKASIGDRVKKGEVLAELNSPDLLSLQRMYLKAESELQLGLISYQRDKKLHQEGVIAERRWQETNSQYHAFASEASEHRQLLEIAGMTDADIRHLKRTHRLSSRLNVLSPISGTVMERMGVSGSRVDILAPLYRIAKLDELWLEINIPQERATQVQIGDSVVLENDESIAITNNQDSQSEGKVTAKISLISQNVNPENQTVLARAVIDGKQSSIRPGQRINIRIIQTTEKPAYKVPNVAIAQHEGKSYLFIHIQDGFRVIPVTVIGKQGETSVISGHLTGSEKIAIKGAVALKANWLGLGSDE